MKTIRLAFLLIVSVLATNVSSFAYVVSPQSAITSVAAEDASSTAMSAKALKKEQKKEARAQKRAERSAKFMAWVSRVMAGDQQVVAVILAFFLGIFGIHRVYLGGSPLLIVLYIITVGGIFGIIPFIDFIRLLIGQVDHYEGNSNLFRAFQPTGAGS